MEMKSVFVVMVSKWNDPFSDRFNTFPVRVFSSKSEAESCVGDLQKAEKIHISETFTDVIGYDIEEVPFG